MIRIDSFSIAKDAHGKGYLLKKEGNARKSIDAFEILQQRQRNVDSIVDLDRRERRF